MAASGFLTLPGILLAAAVLSFVRWTVILLPHILDIANKITGVEKTRELFIRLIKEAFFEPDAIQAFNLMLLITGAAIVIVLAAYYLWRNPDNLQIQTSLAAAWLAAGIGAIVLTFVYSEVMAVYASSVETGIDPGIFPQLISITSGLILLFIGWLIWNRAKDQLSTPLFFLRLLGAMFFMVGGWLLIGELPMIVASGDKNLWVGLRATIFYSLGTVPFQLGISLIACNHALSKLERVTVFPNAFLPPLCDTHGCRRGCIPTIVLQQAAGTDQFVVAFPTH